MEGNGIDSSMGAQTAGAAASVVKKEEEVSDLARLAHEEPSLPDNQRKFFDELTSMHVEAKTVLVYRATASGHGP